MPVTELVVTDGASSELRQVEDVLRAQEYPLSERARAHVDALIEAVVAMVQHAVQRRKREERAQAQATLTQAQAEQAAHASQVAAAEAQHAGSPSGSWVLAAILTPFFLACLGMEFILSWVTLPLLFGVARYSTLGVMLGIGPTSAVAVLKVVIARLVEEPYQQLRASLGASRMHRRGVITVMVLFAIAVGAFNVYTLVLQADVREAVAKAARTMRTGPSSASSTSVDSHDAVVAVSVAAAVDGAIFFLLAWNEGQLWRRRRTARHHLQRARSRARVLDGAVAQAEATLTVRLQEDLDEAARVAGNRRRAELQIACDEEESRQRQARSMTGTVNRQLHLVEVR
jgi:hypothetical protein